MIAHDQPTCFPDTIIARVSSRNDGTMLNRSINTHHPDILANRKAFCQEAGIDYTETVYQRIVYEDTRSYELIADVDRGSVSRVTPEVVADALYTRVPGVALFLPVADCAATVVYDMRKKTLAVAHLGRHSTYAKLATRLVRHFIADGSNPKDLIVWMCPHAQKESYKLAWFDRSDDPTWQGFYQKVNDGVLIDLAGYNRSLFIANGVLADNIHVSTVDTMKDAGYFSHAQGDTTERIAVVAMMRT